MVPCCVGQCLGRLRRECPLVDITASFRRPPREHHRTVGPPGRVDHTTRQHYGRGAVTHPRPRRLAHDLSEIGSANPTVVANPFVMGHFNTLYYRRALVSVRAMVDPNVDSDSLLTLLTDIAAPPGDLEIIDPEMQQAGNSTIDPAKVLADIDRLKAAAAGTKKYVNKRITHIDRKGTPTVPTAPEMDAAIELMGELLHKYTLLLTGADLRLGVLVAFDWTSVFTVPWIDPGSAVAATA